MKKNNKYSVLLLLRKNDIFCINFSKFISKICKKKKILWTEPLKKYSIQKLFNYDFDYIISYRSPIILKNKDISKASIAAINLHPGPPKYRGIGCLNYALYNNEKKYGFTIHLINKKIDFGEILYVKNFPVKKTDTVESLLERTHEECIKSSKPFFKDIFKDQNNINFYKKKFKNQRWSNIIKNKTDLDNFYKIKNFNLKEIKKKIRATDYLNYKPFIEYGNFKFYLR